jgi:hypothetical protein
MPLGSEVLDGLSPREADVFAMGIEYSAFMDIARDPEVMRFSFQVHAENLDRLLRLLRANGWSTTCTVPSDGWSWLEGWRTRHGL